MLRTRIAIGAAAMAVVAAGAAGAAVGIGGVWPSSGDTHPPCEQLPTAATVGAALDRNPDLAAELESLGRGVAVGVGRPCGGGADRALVEVRYGTDGEHDAVADLLTRRDGFGVPVSLVER